jgi:hypothetical protein
VTKEKRQAEYLLKAKEAEEQAAKLAEPDLQERWRRIAAGYRMLAGVPEPES